MAGIWEIENVYQNEDRRLWGFLLQSFFDHFPASEFFNSHSPLHSSTVLGTLPTRAAVSVLVSVRFGIQCARLQFGALPWRRNLLILLDRALYCSSVRLQSSD
jgi:hypothetical protein